MSPLLQTDELVIEDDDAVIAWAEATYGAGGVIRTKKALDRKALRDYIERVKAADVQPPGVRLEQRDDQFFATPAKD